MEKRSAPHMLFLVSRGEGWRVGRLKKGKLEHVWDTVDSNLKKNKSQER